MNERKAKVLSIVIHLPIKRAIEIFRESGDLPVSEFPAIVKFAERSEKSLIWNKMSNILCDKIKATIYTYREPSELKPAVSEFEKYLKQRE